MTIDPDIFEAAGSELPEDVLVDDIVIHIEQPRANGLTPGSPQLIVELIDTVIARQRVAPVVVGEVVGMTETGDGRHKSPFASDPDLLLNGFHRVAHDTENGVAGRQVEAFGFEG